MNHDRGIAFDMDGVIIDGMKYHVQAWQKTFQRYLHIEIDEHQIYLGEGIKGEAFIDQVAAAAKVDLLPEEKAQIHKFKRQYFNEIFRVEPIPGAKQSVVAAKEMGYSLALVTGTGRDVATSALSDMGIIDRFDLIVSGDDVRYGKPSPEPYLIAAAKLDVYPTSCLVVENAPAGIVSAKAANMICIALETSLGADYLHGADLILPGHPDFQSWLRHENLLSGRRGIWIL